MGTRLQPRRIAPTTMLNRLSNTFADSDRSPRSGTSVWQVDGNPNARLLWLGTLFIIPLLAVVLRLAHVQNILQASIVDRYEQTIEVSEAIPSRDGRILSSDGRVLAYDVERYDIHAHYRWIETPADEDWLRERALSKLSRTDRRDRELIEQATAKQHEHRDAMWSRVAQLAQYSHEELLIERQKIQQRIERIVARVEQRRKTSSEQTTVATPDVIESETDEGWWTAVSERVVTTLTTPPRRGRSDPVIIQEELDYHPVLEDVPHEVAAEIEAHPELFPGLRILNSTRRVYPAHDVAAHIIGSRLLVDAAQVTSRRERFPEGDPLDYQVGDRIGKTGIESSYNRYLRGLRGERRITRNRRGEVIETRIVRPPQIGRDVVLTLNLPLQERAEYFLDEAIKPPTESSVENAPQSSKRGAAIVAIDVHTGEVLAAASAPRFDLNLLVSPDADKWRAVVSDPRRPMFDRPTRMTLPPGSVFKTLTSIALMESGRFDPDAHIHCQGFLDNPNRYRCYIYRHYGVGHAEMDLTDALARSCNVYFFSAARDAGPEPIVDWARRFGFGRPTGIDLPGERGGNLPAPPDMPAEESRDDRKTALTTSSENKKPHPWYPGDTLGLAIGQTRLTVTPLQVARMMATVANGGYLVTPHVARNFGPASTEDEISSFPVRAQSQRLAGLTEATLSRVREGLEKVVANPRGTGYKYVRLKEIAIAGKTGTAEAGGRQGDHAWFAGYVPANKPRIAFVVVLEHAGSGGRDAGPVAQQLVQAMLELGILEPTRTAMR